jgi:hypothetical protein
MNENTTNTGQEFKYSLFPPNLLSVLAGLKKLRAYARKFEYKVQVNEEKLAMKMTIRGFTEEDIDFRISYAPVKWGKEEWPDAPPSKWFIYENNSSTLAFADIEMEYCICGFLYLLGNLGKKEILKRLRKNKNRIQKNLTPVMVTDLHENKIYNQ